MQLLPPIKVTKHRDRGKENGETIIILAGDVWEIIFLYLLISYPNSYKIGCSLRILQRGRLFRNWVLTLLVYWKRIKCFPLWWPTCSNTGLGKGRDFLTPEGGLKNSGPVGRHMEDMSITEVKNLLEICSGWWCLMLFACVYHHVFVQSCRMY